MYNKCYCLFNTGFIRLQLSINGYNGSETLKNEMMHFSLGTTILSNNTYIQWKYRVKLQALYESDALCL